MICACLQGIIQVHATGSVQLVTNQGSISAQQPVQELMFVDDLDVASDGTVYFSTMHDIPLIRDKTGEYEPMRPCVLNIYQVTLQTAIAPFRAQSMLVQCPALVST